MDKKLETRILKEIKRQMPWYNDTFVNSVLNEIIENPKITKEELAWIKVRGEDRKTPTDIHNEYVAQKFIDIVNKETK